MPLLYIELKKLMDKKMDYNWEILFVNDGSTDQTLSMIKEFRAEDSRINYVNLSRNFGKENAMLAGFDYVTGDCMVIMDADLQDPPSLIPQMLEYWEEGYQDVYAKRANRGKESWLRRLFSLLFYRILESTTRFKVLQNVGDFRLLDRACINALRQLRESERYTKGMFCWIGFNKKEIVFDRADATLNLALPSLLISALNAILAAYSEVYILVLGIYYKLQTFVYLPANGIVQGMRPLIGYNYGAGEHQRVSQIFKIVLCMSGIIMVFGTVICLLIPGQLMGLFTHTEATIQAGETALRIIGAGFIVSAVSVTSSGALEGLGKGTPSLLISLCRYVVVIIPAAFLLSRFFGAVGVWNAFWITEAITAIISLVIYRKAITGP